MKNVANRGDVNIFKQCLLCNQILLETGVRIVLVAQLENICPSFAQLVSDRAGRAEESAAAPGRFCAG